MAVKIPELTVKIEENARLEFMQYGFKDASINRIASNAGLTTGAIYTRFKDKDALFVSLVQPTIDEVNQLFYSMHGKFTASYPEFEKVMETSNQFIENMINYMYDNKDNFILLLCKSSGSSIDHFEMSMIEYKTERLHNSFFKSAEMSEIIQKVPIGEKGLLLIAASQFHTAFDAFKMNFSREEALNSVNLLHSLCQDGLIKMLKAVQ